MKVYIALGANLGDPADNIRRALRLLEEWKLGKVLKVSSFYRTEPVGLKDQPWFVNAAVEIETGYSASALHAGLQAIEIELGRPTERVKDGPRTVDLDLLLYGDAIIHWTSLQVPHPRMHERRFVLAPLAEIAGEASHPVLHKTVMELMAGLKDDSVVEKIG